jgi:hypothetical protein
VAVALEKVLRRAQDMKGDQTNDPEGEQFVRLFPKLMRVFGA